MGRDCCPAPGIGAAQDDTYRRVLWIALVVNGVMFLVEIVASVLSAGHRLSADG